MYMQIKMAIDHIYFIYYFSSMFSTPTCYHNPIYDPVGFASGIFDWYYLLVVLGVRCPRGFDLCCEFDFFYRSRSNKNLVDYMYVWSTDLLISCHVRNNNYVLCRVWIFENKIANTCANVKIYYKYQLIK